SRWLSRVKWRFRPPPHPLLSLDDPRLREAAAPLPADALAPAGPTIRFLEDALHWFQARHGAAHGIAAPQIGIPLRILIVEREGREISLINPVIIRESPESSPVWERCMSFPHLAVRVMRPVSLSVRFVTRDGTPDIWEAVDPDLASLVRHEVDHLDGILTLDRAESPGMVVPWEVLQAGYRVKR
ncbi:MAG: peptide deformylase, partial [Methanomicrobiales archaeon]|nr:peptide deformylase [Methanomicrobiales archaeon]